MIFASRPAQFVSPSKEWVGKISRDFWRNDSFGHGLEDLTDAGAADPPVSDLVIVTRAPPIIMLHEVLSYIMYC